MYKKLLAMLLAAVLAVGLLPVAVFAADSDFVIENGGLTAYNGPGGDVVIPNGVVYIGSGAFAGCDGLTGITIPSGVTTIGDAAFFSCKNLAYVTIPASVTTIMNFPFSECPLKDVYYGGSESQWGEIEHLIVPFGGATAFSDGGQKSAGLGGVTVHYNSTGPEPTTPVDPEPTTPAEPADSDFTIKDGVLKTYNGPGGDVVIPSGVTYIGMGAFYGCDSLTGVTIPSGVTYIDEAAFMSCKNLTRVTIPASVTTIGAGAFNECPLKNVYYGGSESQWGEIENRQPFGAIAFSDGGQELAGLNNVTVHYNSPMPNNPTQPETPKITFTDLASGAYYTDAVAWAVENKVTTGTSGTTFSPDEPCTRGQVVTFLWRAYGSKEPTSTTNPFTDVNPGDYYYNAVLWAMENGIASGTSKTTFSPNDPCIRAQAVTFQYRAAGKPAVSGGSSFTDVPAGSYYADAVAWAVANKVTSGTSSTAFSPNEPCTRGQIVTFLYRELGK